MGNYSTPLELHAGMMASHSGQCVIVAGADQLAALQSHGHHRGIDAARLIALPPAAPLDAAVLDQARVLVLEVDASDDASLRRLAQLRVDRPAIAIIAALREADVSLVRALIRQGVSDVTHLPFAPEELSAQILDALSAQAETAPAGTLGRLFSVGGTAGGAGATSVLTHLAAALAQKTHGGRGIVVIDLDLQGGDTASYLGVEPAVTIEALLEAGSRLDDELVRSAITPTPQGFGLIAAPAAISPVDRIDTDHLLSIVRLARASADLVLLDLPPVWTDWSLSVIAGSDRAVLVTETSIAALRRAKRTLRLMAGIDVPRDRLAVVVNRLEKRLFRTIGTGEVEATLGCPVLGGVADAGPVLRTAQDQGVPVHVTGGKTRFAADIDALADRLLAAAEGN